MPADRISRLVAVVVAVLLLGLAVPSAAASYPPGPEVKTGTLSEAEVRDGTPVVMSGDGFAPAAPLELTDDSTVVRRFRADALGAFSTTVVMRGVRFHTLAVTGNRADGRLLVVSDGVSVLAAQEEPAGGTSLRDSLPTAHTLLALLLGLGLVVLVAGTRVALRARRSPRSQGR